jgi:hypothetical protein
VEKGNGIEGNKFNLLYRNMSSLIYCTKKMLLCSISAKKTNKLDLYY